MSDPVPHSITAIVLTFDEEIHIERCLTRITPFVERVIVVDSFSSDRTVEIAKSAGARVYQRAFKNQADQFQWALDNCEITTEWILRLDADEYLEEPLKAEIAGQLAQLSPQVTGLVLKRKVIFRDRWIRHGGYYPARFLRMWRKGAAQIEQRWMDEHAILLHGQSVTLQKNFVDHNLRDITWWTEKHNRYATRQMVDFINREHQMFPIDNRAETKGEAQVRWKRFLRNSVFGNAPLYLRSLLHFLYRYIIRLGFLDGKQGFVFHSMQGFWFFLLIDVKIEEAQEFIALHGLDAFRSHLARHQGIDL